MAARMKYCQFQLQGQARYGLVEPVAGHEQITRLLMTTPEGSGNLEDATTKRIEPISLAEAKLLGPGENIVRPKISERTDYEGELGVVMSRACHKLGADDDVRSYILGYTAVNDFTARDLQKKDGQWTRGKGFDTFCPVGPLVATNLDPWAGVTVETRVNGEVRQQGTTRDFIFPLDVIIRYICEFMTLLPGDLIATGTPKGVGPVVAGNVVEVRVEGVGILRNPVVDE